MDEVAASLQRWQQRLIDLSRRNRLLHFTPTPSSALRLHQPVPVGLFEQLVLRERAITFFQPDPSELPLEAEGADLEGRAAGRLGGATGRAVRPPRPNELVAEVEPGRLRRTLDRMRLRAQTSVSEQGINTLFVAFGMLEWQERPGVEETLRSPLVLAPVALRRDSAVAPYRLEPLDEEVVVNPALRECLRRYFGHDLEVAVEEQPLLTILEAIQHRLPAGISPRLYVESYLGFFSFVKLSMLKDLEANAEAAQRHPILRVLAGAPARLPEPAGRVPDEAELDEAVPPHEAHHVLDADPTQLRAIEAAKRGASFVLHGPPGTGKSQTIANIIAEFLHAGKTVLFVSEKAAARDVVLARLREVGLADFALSLEGQTTPKREVIRELERTWQRARTEAPAASVVHDLDRLARCRSELNAYAAALGEPVSALGISTFAVHGRLAAVASAPDLLFDMPRVFTLTRAELDRAEDLVKRLQDLAPVVLGFANHPWNGTTVAEYSLHQRREIEVHLGELRRRGGEALAHGLGLAARFGMSLSLRIDDLDMLVGIARHAAASPYPPAAWFGGTSLSTLRKRATAWQERHAAYREARDVQLHRYQPTLLSLDLPAVDRALTEGEAAAREHLLAAEAAPGDHALASQAQLAPRLEAAVRALDAYRRALSTLLEPLNMPAPDSLVEAAEATTLVALALKDPAPDPAWLDPGTFARVDALLRTASEQATALAARDDLLQSYSSELLELAPELADRFAGPYGTWLRWARPAYWSDRARVKRLLPPGTPFHFSEVATILQQGRRARDAETFFAEQVDELRSAFGRRYLGSASDWPALAAALGNARAILDHVGTKPPPEGLARLLTADPSTRAAVQSRLRGVEASRAALERALTGLAADLRLVADARTHSITEVGAALEHVLAKLRAFWEAAQLVSDCRREADPAPSTLAALAADIETANRVVAFERDLAAEAVDLADAFGHLFTGLTTNWDAIQAALDWATGLLARTQGQPPAGLLALVVEGAAPERGRQVGAEAEELAAALGAVRREMAYLEQLFPSGAPARNRLDFWSAPLQVVLDWVGVRLGALDELERWLDCQRVSRDCAAAGLSDFLEHLKREQPPVSAWLSLFHKRLWTLWLDARYRQEPRLREFRAVEHERLIEQFRELDRRSIRAAAERVRRSLLTRLPPLDDAAVRTSSSEPAILQREFRKKRHRPLRRLFAEIPTLLLTLKPCLMLSPLAVSQFLDARLFAFDLVIFDEASQVRPEDAVGSILRGRQLIVAGDNRQLPPTAFFDRTDDDEGDEDDAAVPPGASAASGPEATTETARLPAPTTREPIAESILDECVGRSFRQVWLGWHYRSRHEHLIAFSNEHFYDGRLYTFPSAASQHPRKGVHFVHVPDGVYQPGRSPGAGVNRVEAQRIAQLVVEHAETAARQSLGAIAFSQRQRDAILDELDRIRLQRRDLEWFFSEAGREPFFVKALEHVQGDERDVVILGVGYACDAQGRLSHNFGPLNREGGERRLNVAITRARDLLLLVSSIHAEAIDPRRTASRGAQLLRAYLDYARRGPAALAAGSPTSREEPDSPFEAAVAEALRARGLQVEHQIGCSRYRIDLGIADPERPGHYLLGVECDGATYHTSRVARERDRLRQEVLEQLGWRIHRVWSRDWVLDPQREVEKILRAVEVARRQPEPSSGTDGQVPTAIHAPSRSIGAGSDGSKSHDEGESTAASLPNPVPLPPRKSELAPASVESAPLPRHWPPFPASPLRRQGSPHDFSYVSDAQVMKLIARCVEVQGPVAARHVMRQVASAWGIERVGAQIEARLTRLMRAGDGGYWRLRGEFLWPRNMAEPPVRGPGADDTVRPIDLICDAELAVALRAVLTEAFALEREKLVQETARRLGYLRTGAQIRQRLLSVLDALVADGSVRSTGDRVSLPRRMPARREA